MAILVIVMMFAFVRPHRGLPEATIAVTGMPDRSYQLDGSWPSDRDYGANRYLSRGCASPARAGKMKGVFQCR